MFERQDPTAFSPVANVSTHAPKPLGAFAFEPFADARADKPRAIIDWKTLTVVAEQSFFPNFVKRLQNHMLGHRD